MHKFIVALTAAALLAALAMRKSITLSRRPIRLANDAEWDIFCGIVSLSKDILGNCPHGGDYCLTDGRRFRPDADAGYQLIPGPPNDAGRERKAKSHRNAYKSRLAPPRTCTISKAKIAKPTGSKLVKGPMESGEICSVEVEKNSEENS